jgi:uncharacterized membrane protein YqhA
MPKEFRAFVLVPLATIAYIAISVVLYGNGMTEFFMLLWPPLIAFNTWAIASALPKDSGPKGNLIVALITAFAIALIAALVFMTIAFNAYGT